MRWRWRGCRGWRGHDGGWRLQAGWSDTGGHTTREGFESAPVKLCKDLRGGVKPCRMFCALADVGCPARGARSAVTAMDDPDAIAVLTWKATSDLSLDGTTSWRTQKGCRVTKARRGWDTAPAACPASSQSQPAASPAPAPAPSCPEARGQRPIVRSMAARQTPEPSALSPQPSRPAAQPSHEGGTDWQDSSEPGGSKPSGPAENPPLG